MLFIEKPPLTIEGRSSPETVYLSYIKDIQSLLALIRETNRVKKTQVLPEILQHIIKKEKMDDLLSKTTIDGVIEMANQLDTIEISPRVKEMGELEHHKKNIKIVVVFTETYNDDYWWKQFLPLTIYNAFYMNKQLIMRFLQKLISTVLPNVKNNLYFVSSKHDIFESNNIYKIHEKINESVHIVGNISPLYLFSEKGLNSSL
jgi:hypothetical protein